MNVQFPDNINGGGEVIIIYKLDFQNTVNCVFDFFLYPFDTQHCAVVFSITNSPVHYFNISLREIMYERIANHLPSEYILVGTRLAVKVDCLRYEFSILRLPVFSILSIYIPTMLMHCIGYFTLFIPSSNFQDRGTMSLTTLLVLISLYTDTMNSLPRTSYIKYMDIWFLFSVAFISIIVLAHLFTSNTNFVTKLTKKATFFSLPTNATFMYGCKICFGIGYVIFHALYWISLAINLQHYNLQ